MGTCIAVCGTTARRESEVEKRYIDHTVSNKIEQQLNTNTDSTHKQNEQREQVFCQKGVAQLTLGISDDMVIEIEPYAQKSEYTKSSRGNKSRFYHEKQSAENSLNEDSISLKVNEAQNSVESSIVSSRKKRKPNIRESSKSSELSETSEKSVKAKAKQNSNLSYYSYTKDPTCLFSQKLPMPSNEGLNSQDDYIISLSEKYVAPTAIIQEVHFKDDSVYQGEWMAGMRHGTGTLTWDKNKYQGEFKFNQFWGKGVITFKNKVSYVGEMKENAAWGEGELKIPDGSYYKGSWENNKQHGYGVHYWSKKQKYEGKWVNGLKQGKGTLTFQDGSYYKGQFVMNQLHGQGQYHYFNKMTYSGEWEHNQKSGSGTLRYRNGDVYTGGFSHDKMHGSGILVDAEGKSFSGSWTNGKREGVFVCTFPDGSKTKSEWYYGKLIRTVDDAQQSLGRASKKR